MKRLLMLALAAIVSLAGCATVSPGTPSDLKAQVGKACAVVQPTLASVQAMTPAAQEAQQQVLAKLVADSKAFCDAAAASGDLSTGSLTDFVNAGVPAALRALAVVPMDPAVKTEVQVGLVAFQVAVSAAVQQYGAPK